MLRRLPILALATAAVATCAAAAHAPQESWGKAGVSFAQYRQEALDCGKQAYALDVSDTPDAKVLAKASRELDAITSQGAMAANSSSGSPAASEQMAQYANQQAHVVDSVNVRQRYQDIKLLVRAAMDKCLISHGYSKFQLTDEQRAQLSKMKAGSDQRRQYLYSLASDPAVIASQKATTQP